MISLQVLSISSNITDSLSPLQIKRFSQHCGLLQSKLYPSPPTNLEAAILLNSYAYRVTVDDLTPHLIHLPHHFWNFSNFPTRFHVTSVLMTPLQMLSNCFNINGSSIHLQIVFCPFTADGSTTASFHQLHKNLLLHFSTNYILDSKILSILYIILLIHEYRKLL